MISLVPLNAWKKSVQPSNEMIQYLIDLKFEYTLANNRHVKCRFHLQVKMAFIAISMLLHTYTSTHTSIHTYLN